MSYREYTGFFEMVAQQLCALGREDDKINLVFVDDPEEADPLLSKIRTQIAYPLLLVEYYDENTNGNTTGTSTELSGAFVVLAPVESRANGHDSTRDIIYTVCKPAAEQVFARMIQLSDNFELKVCNSAVQVMPDNVGMWIGPLHNNMYGWRISFKWKFPSAPCFKPESWLL